MLKRGLATVYEAKGGIEWGGMEARYRKAERSAKSRKLGIWGGDMTKFESPRNYKNRQGIVQDYSGN